MGADGGSTGAAEAKAVRAGVAAADGVTNCSGEMFADLAVAATRRSVCPMSRASEGFPASVLARSMKGFKAGRAVVTAARISLSAYGTA